MHVLTMSRPHERTRWYAGKVITYADARRSWVCPEAQPSKDMEEEDRCFEAEPAPAATGRYIVGEISQELGVKRLRVDGIVVGGVVVKAEVLVGHARDLTPVESLQKVCVPRMCQWQWEGDVLQVVLDL